MDKDIQFLLWHGDCLEWMKRIPDKSVDFILADLPYKKGMGKWDSIIDLDPMWKEYARIIKDYHAIALFGQNPFSASLILSNPTMYKYNWIWDKGKSGNIFTAKLSPLITHEDILIFSNGTIANGSKKNMVYYPQMIKLDKPEKYRMYESGKSFQRDSHKQIVYQKTHNYPKSVYPLYNGKNQGKKLHPTQKPVALLEYLIRTYTLENETVLDNTMGSA
jgi:site-specific DNA-methyltransferase (adenine-specific)